jgi:hypothetical protein
VNDKAFHFLGGTAFSVIGAACWYASGADLALLPWFALLASGVAGVTKEAADWMGNHARPGSHGVEWLDFVATLAGGVPVVVISLI